MPASAPSRIVANPKIAGIGHTDASGVSGTAPKMTPTTPPNTAEPTRTESALRRSCCANCSMIAASKVVVLSTVVRMIGSTGLALESGFRLAP